MEQASGNGGNLNRDNTVDVVTPKATTLVQSLRHSLPAIGTRGKERTPAEPPKLLHAKRVEGHVGNRDDETRESATGTPRISHGFKGGVEDGDGRGEEGGEYSGGKSTIDSATAAAVAAAAAELAAAALAASSPPGTDTSGAASDQQSDLGSSASKKAEEHLSCKYTKEELLARHWGMNVVQMKRVKALLRLGVCEEDLEVADRLLKLGRDIANDTPLTKEEQLLGYTSQQRQRIKALQILGLTEESFERCRAVMLSSLGPSAFGYNADETAASAARAVAEEGWTPGEKFRRKGPGQHFRGDSSGLLRMPTFGKLNSQNPLIGNSGGNGGAMKFPSARLAGGLGGMGLGMGTILQTRRASDSDKGGYLPDVITTTRNGRGAGGGTVAVGMPQLDKVVGNRVKPPPRIAAPHSTSSDPR